MLNVTKLKDDGYRVEKILHKTAWDFPSKLNSSQ